MNEFISNTITRIFNFLLATNMHRVEESVTDPGTGEKFHIKCYRVKELIRIDVKPVNNYS